MQTPRIPRTDQPRPSEIPTDISTRATDPCWDRRAGQSILDSLLGPRLNSTELVPDQHSRDGDNNRERDRAYGTPYPLSSWYDVTRDTRSDRDPEGRSVHFADVYQSDRLPHTPLYDSERSVLIPYGDLRAARASLPEFSGTKAEDPVRFLQNTESILGQARIPSAGWTRAVES